MPKSTTKNPTPSNFGWCLQNNYATELSNACIEVQAALSPKPEVVLLNHDLAQDLGLDLSALDSESLAQLFCGNTPPEQVRPIAQAYAGHQFGHFSPSLGDGRALLFGEQGLANGDLFDIALKGSGPTPFSRGGDGFAALGPMLREYIMGETMHALGIPSTRALAVVQSGRTLHRQGPSLKGAVLTRIAASHLRVGTLQYFSARKDIPALQKIALFAIARHDPELLHRYASDDTQLYLEWFSAVIQRQASLIAQWMQVGFVHGVMNTDNMALSGQTIDYGPCAWLDNYQQDACFSSIDTHGRYAFGQQPAIAAWNLARFGESLLPLLETFLQAEQALEQLNVCLAEFQTKFSLAYEQGMYSKLGLDKPNSEADDLLEQLLSLLQQQKADYTLSLRYLAFAAIGQDERWLALLENPEAGHAWLNAWRSRWQSEGKSAASVVQQIQAQNPLYIARNHQVEAVLEQAELGQLNPLRDFLQVLQHPFTERKGLEQYTLPANTAFTSSYQTFCGT